MPSSGGLDHQPFSYQPKLITIDSELRTDGSEKQSRSSGKEKSNMKMASKMRPGDSVEGDMLDNAKDSGDTQVSSQGKEVVRTESSPEVRWKVSESSDSMNPVVARQDLSSWERSSCRCQ
ncbi:unnamed protein product [Caretta caretta]